MKHSTKKRTFFTFCGEKRRDRKKMSTRLQRGERTRGIGGLASKKSGEHHHKHHSTTKTTRWELDSSIQWGVDENDAMTMRAPGQEKTALVTKWVKVISNEEEDEEEEGVGKKYEVIKRVAYESKSKEQKE